jgi:hypothetical protein
MRCVKGPRDVGAGQLRGLSGSDAIKFGMSALPRKLPRLSLTGASAKRQKATPKVWSELKEAAKRGGLG